MGRCRVARRLHLKGFNHPILAVEILRCSEEGEDVEAS